MAEEILHISQDTKRPPFESLTALANEASHAGMSATLILQPEDDDTHRKKRYHDLTTALRTLNLSLAALHEGYRFDDQRAPAKIKAMEKAVATLERESSLWQSLLLKK